MEDGMADIKPSLYVESTIPSYITARDSNDVVKLAKQLQSRDFWEHERYKYDLCVSPFVTNECGKGDAEAAKKRLALIAELRSLPTDEAVDDLAEVYKTLLRIPDRAVTDCNHLAVCVLNGIHFLLTWNCAHLGLRSYEKVKTYNDGRGLWTPKLVTPANIVETEVFNDERVEDAEKRAHA
jgi:hypothetical protein